MGEAIYNAHVVSDAFLLDAICERYNFTMVSAKLSEDI
jgi:hypothetical protein